ncbi:hypothetical protein MNB_SV-12-817 [hydrothermal vent metagenome]|uniref:Uncharacterized protein n=1 Tax=hydrothermal vent metagenome TaxID=652676 RepID=A0A1W1CEZ1_9ZZZZ
MRFILIVLIAFSLVDAGGVLKVEWPKTTTQQEKSMKPYPKVLKDGIKEVTLPVYLPRYYIYKKNISIVSDKNFYAITIFLKGASLMITGDRTYQQKVKLGGKQLKTKMKAVDTKFVRAEGIISIDFNRHGVNYSLALECDSPSRDKRCIEDSFLKRVYRGLVIVGGKK